MSKYRVVRANPGRRTAVFDAWGRCVELVRSDMTDAELAALITDQDRLGAYVVDRFTTQRVFDSVTREWTEVEWPVEE